MGWFTNLFRKKRIPKHVIMPDFSFRCAHAEVAPRVHVGPYDINNSLIRSHVNCMATMEDYIERYQNKIADRFDCMDNLDAQLSGHDKFYWSSELKRIQMLMFGELGISGMFIAYITEGDDNNMDIWFNTGREFMDHAQMVIRNNIRETVLSIYQNNWCNVVEALIKHRYIVSQKDYDYYFELYLKGIDNFDGSADIASSVKMMCGITE